MMLLCHYHIWFKNTEKIKTDTLTFVLLLLVFVNVCFEFLLERKRIAKLQAFPLARIDFTLS